MTLFSGVDFLSSVDYPSSLAMTFFVRHCPWSCVYCQNKGMLATEDCIITIEQALKWVYEREDFLDAIVISGGEPSCYLQELEIFIQEIKKYGILKMGIHTNGLNVLWIQKLLFNNLLDYVGLDVKAPSYLYSRIAGADVQPDFLIGLRPLISDPRVELRTTIGSGFLQEQHLVDLAMELQQHGVKRWCLQQARGDGAFPTSFLKSLKGFVPEIIVRGLNVEYEFAL